MSGLSDTPHWWFGLVSYQDGTNIAKRFVTLNPPTDTCNHGFGGLCRPPVDFHDTSPGKNGARGMTGGLLHPRLGNLRCHDL